MSRFGKVPFFSRSYSVASSQCLMDGSRTHKDKWQTTCLPQGLGPKEHMKMEQLTHLSSRTGPEVALHSQSLFVRCDKEEGALRDNSLSSIRAVAWHLLHFPKSLLVIKSQPGFLLHHRKLWNQRVKNLSFILLNRTYIHWTKKIPKNEFKYLSENPMRQSSLLKALYNKHTLLTN